MLNDNKVEILKQVAKLIEIGECSAAKGLVNKKYPFRPIKKVLRSYTMKVMMEQFFRDGFIDRYSGDKLINPGMLRVLSEKMPKEFPYQAHWKTDECHMAYWEFQPTIDHIVPIAHGGEDKVANWATTSMVNNSAKSNFTLEQLGWTLKSQGDITEWDGLSQLFIKIVDENKSLLEVKKIRGWYRATKRYVA